MASRLPFKTTKKPGIFNDNYFAWIGQSHTLYGPHTTDAVSGQVAKSQAIAKSPAILRGAAAGTGMMGSGRADPVRRKARLKPTATRNLVSATTDVIPSAAAMDAAPYLEGEDGPVPYNTAKRRRVQAATLPQAVAPGAMLQSRQVNGQPHANSISTQHIPDPDPTLPGRLMERDKQLPSSGAYRGQMKGIAGQRDAGIAGMGAPQPPSGAGARAVTEAGGVRSGGIFLRTPAAAAEGDEDTDAEPASGPDS